MKKLFICMFALFACSAMYSQTIESESPSMESASQTDGKTVSTFYGSKASSNANNPCKGATTRVCGKIESELVAIAVEQTMVIQHMKDTDGELLSTSNIFVGQPLEEVKESLKIQTINLGGTFEDYAE